MQVRVYYEDTDAGGIVYYANYLKYAERGRTEFLRELGVNQSELAEKQDIYFVVRKAEMNLKKPARLDDLLVVETFINKRKNVSIEFGQLIKCDGKILAEITTLVACVNGEFVPTKIPDKIVVD